MKLLILATTLALAAGAAHADPLREAAFRTHARPAAAVAVPAGVLPARPAGIARTSLDHRFERDRLDGAVGFLCGLQPSANTSGAAAAAGVDPHGRFLGVQLKMSLR